MMPVFQGGRVLRLADDIARPCPLDRTVTQGDNTGAPPSQISALDESLGVSHSLGRWTPSVVGSWRLDHARQESRTFTQAGHGQFSLSGCSNDVDGREVRSRHGGKAPK